jgi:flagellar biosynthetic protein FliR
MLTALTTEMIFHFALIFSRIGGVFSFAPGIGELFFPVRIRLTLAVTTCLVMYPVLRTHFEAMPLLVSEIVGMIFIEFLIGILIGLSAKIYLLALDVVGNIIAMNAGLASANFFNPNMRSHQPILSILLILTATAGVFATSAHHYYLLGIVESYDKFPAGQMIVTGDLSNYIAKTVAGSFLLAFKIASPFIVVNLALQTGAAALSRLMPSLQIFFIILPAQIIAMLSVLLVVIPFMNDRICLELMQNIQLLLNL